MVAVLLNVYALYDPQRRFCGGIDLADATHQGKGQQSNGHGRLKQDADTPTECAGRRHLFYFARLRQATDKPH